MDMKKIIRVSVILLFLLSLIGAFYYLFLVTDFSESKEKLIQRTPLETVLEEEREEENTELFVEEDTFEEVEITLPTSIYDGDRLMMDKIEGKLVGGCYFDTNYDGEFHDQDLERKYCKISWVGYNAKGTWICSAFRREYCCKRYEVAGGFQCPHKPYNVQVSKKDDWKSNIVLAESKHWTGLGKPINVPGWRSNTTMFTVLQLESVDRYQSMLDKSFYSKKYGDKRVDSAWGNSEEYFNETMITHMPNMGNWKVLLDQKDRDYNFASRKFATVFQSNSKYGCMNWQRVQFIRYMVRTSEKRYKDQENKIVHSYGSVCKNQKTKTPFWDLRYNDKDKINKNYLFTLALENFVDDWTATPRLWNALYTGTVPVFVGAAKVDEMWPFENKGFINVRDFGDVHSEETWAKVLDHMYELSEDESKWMEYQKWRSEESVSKEWVERWGLTSSSDFFCNICEHYHEVFLPSGGHKDKDADKTPHSHWVKMNKGGMKCPSINSDCKPFPHVVPDVVVEEE